MKRKFLVLITLVLTLACALCASALIVSAEESAPSVSIEKFNLAFEDNTYLKYAVKFTGVDDAKITKGNIGMLYWIDYESGFVPGTEDFSSETTGYTEIDGVKHYVFEYTHLAAKQLTDYIYSVAYLEYNGETYYSEPVKYSALEYAYNRLGKTSEGTTNEELKSLLNNMLAYGASAQQYFNYKEDRLATADFYLLSLVGGTLDDGFASGLYLSTDKVTITAPEDDGKTFAGWKNSAEEIVYTDNPTTVENLTANTTLTAAYEDAVKYSEGLEFVSNGDGTCSVVGIGECTDTILSIPLASPDGDIVTEISEGAFSSNLNVTELVIPDTVTNVGAFAFYHCRALEKLSINGTQTNLSYGSFNYCDYLKDIYINSNIMTVAEEVFHYSGWGADVVFGKDVVSIPNNLFKSSNIKSVKFESGSACTTIGDYAFSGCSWLVSVELPEKITSIGTKAFYSCGKLLEIINRSDLAIVVGSNDYGSVALNAVEIHENESKIVNIENFLFYSYNGENHLISYCGGYSREQTLTFPNFNGNNYIVNAGALPTAWVSLKTLVIPSAVKSIEGLGSFNSGSNFDIIVYVGITKVASGAFPYSNVKNVYFTGSEEEFAQIDWNIPDSWNGTIHYNYIPEE